MSAWGSPSPRTIRRPRTSSPAPARSSVSTSWRSAPQGRKSGWGAPRQPHPPGPARGGGRGAGVGEGVPLAAPPLPVISNVTAEPVRPAEEIRRLLVRQVAAPVRWEESVRRMTAMGVSVFIEVGPGTSLSGLIKKTVAATVLHVEDVPTLEQTLRSLGALHILVNNAGVV